jgi:hypothetical protein
MEIQSPEVIPTPEHVATLDRLGDEIAELAAHLDAATARLLDLIREFDAREGWGNGFRSCADWLSWRVGLDKGAARERVRVARALGTLPRLAQALAGGEISYSKVRALTRVATPETEEQLLGVARAGTAVHVERIVRGWRHMDRKAEAQVLPDIPPAPVVPADPLQALRATNVGHGLHIDARTACAGWRGERLNVGWAIDVLHPRANLPQVGRVHEGSEKLSTTSDLLLSSLTDDRCTAR